MIVRRSVECRHVLWIFCILAVLTLATALIPLLPVRAEDQTSTQPLVNLGDAFVTGFSGVKEEVGTSETDQKDAEKLFIDPDGASLRGFDLSNPSAKGPLGQPLAPEFLTITAREIGQVFGIALDDALHPAAKIRAPNIYVTATSVYGLPIVAPDKDNDGSPKRLISGSADAKWMEGLFGENGGPGSIWKIDGLTGEVSLFATIIHNKKSNGGAGLGNIAFDAKNQQFFVSDRDTGLIHRLDKIGNLVGAFDHGATGRVAIGLEAAPLDAENRADITSESFKSDDPSTWGLADPKRRVWGLAVHDNRVYYAVAEGPQVWSVGLKDDGSFDASSVRWELDLPDDVAPNEIADIAFNGVGQMFLAQRPAATAAQDFRALVKAEASRVLRYALEDPDDPKTKTRWESNPDEYAIGLTGEHRSASGGVAPGYGYGQDGKLDPTACEATLWATGDGIADSPLKTVAAAGEAKLVTGDGLQGSPMDKVRPDNVPPTDSYAIDLDGQFPDDKESGHVGDIEIASQCPAGGEAPADEPGLLPPDAAMPAEPGFAPEAPYPGGPGVAPGVPYPGDAGVPPGGPYPGDQGVMPPGPPGTPAPQQADLTIDKQLSGPCQQGGDCNFEIVVTNQGQADYEGPLVVSDTMSIPGVTLATDAPAPWKCQQGGQGVTCTHPTLLVKPGKPVSLPLTLRDPGDPNITNWENCAALKWLGAGAGTKESVTAVQAELAALGYYTGEIDGIAGAGTAKAIRDLEKASGIPETGKITPEFLEWLFGQGASTATDEDAGNDGPVCATVETQTVPPGDAIGSLHLKIEKTADSDKCAFGSLCPFTIKVTNPTDQPTKSTFEAVDTMTRTHDGAVLANSIPVGEAPGLCTSGEGPAGVAKTPLKCTAEINLGPNESKTYKIGIKVDDPKLDPGNNSNLDPDPNVSFIAAENCISLHLPAAGSPGWGVVFAKDCATVLMGEAETAQTQTFVDTEVASSFDLVIEKSLTHAGIAAQGAGVIEGCTYDQPCRFTITITNKGPEDYVGPLIVTDRLTQGGWKLVEWTGPTVCEKNQAELSEYSCSMAPQVTLASGQSIEWRLVWQNIIEDRYVPKQFELRNCAEFLLPYSKGDSDQTNNRACATATLPPIGAGPKLEISKRAISKKCERGKVCKFEHRITNNGGSKFFGRLVLEESNFAAPGIKRTPTNEKYYVCEEISTGKYRCEFTYDLEIATGNQSFASGRTDIILPKNLDHRIDKLQSCSSIVSAKQANSTLPPVEKIGPRACAEVDVQPEWDLAITKEGPPICYVEASGRCPFNIWIKNISDTVYWGTLGVVHTLVDEAKGHGIKLREHKPYPWDCSDTSDGVIDCGHPITRIEPGQSVRWPLTLVLDLPPRIPQSLKALGNCVTVQYRGQGRPDAKADNDTVCITTPLWRGEANVQAVTDWGEVALNVLFPPYCVAEAITNFDKDFADKCTDFEFEITSTGKVPYDEQMTLKIEIPPDSRFASIQGKKSAPACPSSGWNCSTSGKIATCRPASCKLDPTQKTSVLADVSLIGKPIPVEQIPPEGLPKEVCGELEWFVPSKPGDIEQQGSRRVSRKCGTTQILAPPKPKRTKPVECPKDQGWKPYPEDSALLPGWKLKKFGSGTDAIFCMKLDDLTDLQVSTVPKGKCTKGQTCAVETSLGNVGKSAHAGAIEIRGQITPPVSIRGLVPSPGWTCRTLGGGRYSCRKQPGEFAPEASAHVKFGLAIPSTFKGTQITHAVKIIWPQGEKDANPANDSALFSIPIVVPETTDPSKAAKDPCTGGKVPYVPPGGYGIRSIVCKCPDGTTEISGQCVELKMGTGKVIEPCPDGKVRVGTVSRATGPDGSFSFGSWECVCPDGTTEINGKCEELKVAPADVIKPCTGGKVRVRTRIRGYGGWKCVCPRGKVEIRGICKNCPVNTVEVNGICKPKIEQKPGPITKPCTGGKVRVGKNCVCPRYTVETRGGICRRCPPNTTQVGGRCVAKPKEPSPVPKTPCIPPYQWNGRMCVRPPTPVPPCPKSCPGNSIVWQCKCTPCAPGKRANKAANRCERINTQPPPQGRIPMPAPPPQTAPAPRIIQPLPQQPQIKRVLPMQPPPCPPNHYWDWNKRKCMARGTIR